MSSSLMTHTTSDGSLVNEELAIQLSFRNEIWDRAKANRSLLEMLDQIAPSTWFESIYKRCMSGWLDR